MLDLPIGVFKILTNHSNLSNSKNIVLTVGVTVITLVVTRIVFVLAGIRLTTEVTRGRHIFERLRVSDASVSLRAELSNPKGVDFKV